MNHLEHYFAAWARSLERLLAQLTSATWKVETGSRPADYVPLATMAIAVKGSLAGGQRLSLTTSDAGALLGLFLGQPSDVGQILDDTQREATEELVRQLCGLAASELKPQFGEVVFDVTWGIPGSSGEASSFLHASDGSRHIVLALDCDDALQQSLQPERPAGRVDELLHQGNLDLLMDVELPVMLRFGSRQASLREVLNLVAGAVVELDREVEEPVDLVLNERVIARGEVVVVDGNYGLRVLEVASRQQRAESLRS